MNRGMRYFAVVLVVSLASVCIAQEAPKASETPKDKAWTVLYAGLADSNMDKRAKAVQVLGLLPNDPQAEEAALHALKDEKPEVRAAAAAALGDMKAKRHTAVG